MSFTENVKTTTGTSKSVFYKIGESENFDVYIRLWGADWNAYAIGILPIHLRLRFESKTQGGAASLAEFDFGKQEWTGGNDKYKSVVAAIILRGTPAPLSKYLEDLGAFDTLMADIAKRFPTIKFDLDVPEFKGLCNEILLSVSPQVKSEIELPPYLFNWASPSDTVQTTTHSYH